MKQLLCYFILASILYKSIPGRYRFIKNAYWDSSFGASGLWHFLGI